LPMHPPPPPPTVPLPLFPGSAGVSGLGSCSGVLAPAGPLYAPLGGSVVLPCQLSPALSARAMQVTWSRPWQGQDVHEYWPDGHEEQGPAYRGRTELLRDGIQQGRLALRIWNLTLPDEGPYLCDIRSNATRRSGTVTLHLTRSGSDPVLHIGLSQDKRMSVTCLSEGWYPAPEVFWRNGDGQNLTLSEKKKFTMNQGLYDICSSVVLTENSAPTLVCAIRPGAPGPEKVLAIRLSEDFFPRAASWKVGLSLFLSVCMCLLFLLASRLWRARSPQRTAGAGGKSERSAWGSAGRKPHRRRCSLPQS
uniref:Butyrophilin subfamily 3 member A2-like n=1 Tax=Pelodiscus sinensis TaxID=13735 RepID=K7GDM4_PELSI